jgi:ferredoxin
MNTIKKLIPVLMLLAILGIILSCTDSVDKSTSYDDIVRIEFSDCTSCYECTDRFDCPENAIKTDELTGRAYIDADLCVQCMECTNIFQCPENAFKTQPDLIPPAAITQLSGYSPDDGVLSISFVASGDDSLSGRTYQYEVKFTNENNENLELDFTPPLPFVSGYWEYWEPIDSLATDSAITFHITAVDEVGNRSTEATTTIAIMEHDPPAAITDLTQINTTTDEFTLNWTAVGDDGLEGIADSYIIKISIEEITSSSWGNLPEYPNDLNPMLSGELEEFIISGLEPDTSYYVAVKAIDDFDNVSPLSNVLSVVTLPIMDIVPPAAITDLQIDSNSISMNAFSLNWTAVGDDGLEGIADSYIIKIHTESIDESNWDSITEYQQNLVPAISGSPENITITGLDPLTEYYVAIKAVDDGDNLGSISNIANAVTTEIPDTDPPAAIDDLDAEATETTIELNWTSPGDDDNIGVAANYEIRYSEIEIDESNWSVAEILSNPPLPMIAGTLQSYSATDLDLNIIYYFAIKTSDESSNISTLSNVADAMMMSDSTPPATITDLIAEGAEMEIVLSWTAPGDDGDEGTADHYEIRLSDAAITATNWDDAGILPGPPWPLVAGSPQNFTVEGLEHNQTYYFAIKAFDDNTNVSEVSNSPSGTLINDVIPPEDITNLSVYEGSAANLSTIKIQWTAPGDNGDEGTCDHYEVRYSTQEITEANWSSATLFNDPPDPLAAGANQFCNVTGLSSATIYYFAVKAFDEAGNDNSVSNSPAGKIVYQINTAACHNCANCINDCDQNAILQGAGYKYINPDECTACGDCTCPWNLIYRAVVAY